MTGSFWVGALDVALWGVSALLAFVLVFERWSGAGAMFLGE